MSLTSLEDMSPELIHEIVKDFNKDQLFELIRTGSMAVFRYVCSPYYIEPKPKPIPLGNINCPRERTMISMSLIEESWEPDFCMGDLHNGIILALKIVEYLEKSKYTYKNYSNLLANEEEKRTFVATEGYDNSSNVNDDKRIIIMLRPFHETPFTNESDKLNIGVIANYELEANILLELLKLILNKNMDSLENFIDELNDGDDDIYLLSITNKLAEKRTYVKYHQSSPATLVVDGNTISKKWIDMKLYNLNDIKELLIEMLSDHIERNQ